MYNVYHRYLNLPFEIKPPKFFEEEQGNTIKHYVLDDLDYPDIDNFFSQFNLMCGRKECFYTPPYGKVPIHTDHESYTNHIKINITWGPEEGVIQWWESDITEEKIIDGNLENTSAYHHNLWAKEEDCRFLYQANTNIPSLVNVGVLHGTNNPTPVGRWTLCFVPLYKKNSSNYIQRNELCVEWNDAMKIFKNYIEES